MTWSVSTAVLEAQLAATIAQADSGPGNARLQFFTNAYPGPGAPGQAPQAEIVLAKPCATVTGGVLSFALAAEPGGLVLTAGIPRWVRWLSASGNRIADGTVTDAASGGDVQITGGTTPSGDNSPMLLAGSIIQLASSALT
jgi:hypothetical protein